MFKFDYTLNLKEDLQSLGIKDVFNEKKANLSKLTKEKGIFIDNIAHKANIEFSNDGIKAGAVTEVGPAGATSCEFRYDFPVPIKRLI